MKPVNVFKCPECDYRFDEQQGDDNEGYLPGTDFLSLPDDFSCPDCSVRFKNDFVKVGE